MTLASVSRWFARIAVGFFLTAVLVAGPASATPPGQSKAFGKSLTEWMTLYMTWALGGDQEDHVGKVRFMPLPAGEYTGEGSFTAADPGVLEGTINVTMKQGTAFAMPVSVWYGEVYSNLAVDPILPDTVFTESNVCVKVDGKTILSSLDDLSKFYVPPTEFDPPIVYDEPTDYGSVGALFFQGLGFVHQPLSVGKHRMTVRSEIIVYLEDDDGNVILNLGVIYENTWNITVTK